MKLASLKGGRDGRLVVVSRDLGLATSASHIAPTLQAVLDDWDQAAPRLEALSRQLNLGTAPGEFRFEPGLCASPLPRA